MTILVTGATGAVGARLVDRLVAEGREPRVASVARPPCSIGGRNSRPSSRCPASRDDPTSAPGRPPTTWSTRWNPRQPGTSRSETPRGAVLRRGCARGEGRARDLPGPRQGRRGALRASREPSRDGPHPRRGWSARARVPSCDGRERRQRLVHDADRSREPAPGDGGAPLGRHASQPIAVDVSSATSWRGWRRRSTVTAPSWRSGDPT